MKVCKFLFAKSPPCTKACTKTSLSRYYTLCFWIKQYNFHLLIYSQRPVVRHLTNRWHLSHFQWTTAFTRTLATSILWCYNFNGMIKWYDISCATLYNTEFKIPFSAKQEINLIQSLYTENITTATSVSLLIDYLRSNCFSKQSINRILTKPHAYHFTFLFFKFHDEPFIYLEFQAV